MDDKPTDPITFVCDLVGGVLWTIGYHEAALSTAYQKLRFAGAIIKRGDFDLDGERAVHDDDDDETFENVEQFALSIFDDCKDSVEYHERGLAKAHADLAMAKIMLERGSYTEIDIEKIKADQKRRREEKSTRGK